MGEKLFGLFFWCAFNNWEPSSSGSFSELSHYLNERLADICRWMCSVETKKLCSERSFDGRRSGFKNKGFEHFNLGVTYHGWVQRQRTLPTTEKKNRGKSFVLHDKQTNVPQVTFAGNGWWGRCAQNTLRVASIPIVRYVSNYSGYGLVKESFTWHVLFLKGKKSKLEMKSDFGQGVEATRAWTWGPQWHGVDTSWSQMLASVHPTSYRILATYGLILSTEHVARHWDTGSSGWDNHQDASSETSPVDPGCQS